MLKTEEIIAIEERWKEYTGRILFRKLVAIFLVLLFIASLTLLFLVMRESLGAHDDPVKTQIQNNNTSVIEQNAITAVNATTANNELENISASNNGNITRTNDTQPVQSSVGTQRAAIPPVVNRDDSSKVETNTDNKQPSLITEQFPGMQSIIAPPIENKIFIETNDISNIEELIKKFEASNNIVFATMISEEYFERKDYKKSLEWALRANEIDSQNELSWIMFARNQVKLGKREDAIRALEIYTNYAKDAVSASNLLQNIKSGEYK
ncbi:MAG: CDC27 family protein [Campylobacteraceae bacterium]|jgi:tetratricopeptide (TPR) repeat protein|nr:CDC27 family protein [Campylobacteraceae bacterium]